MPQSARVSSMSRARRHFSRWRDLGRNHGSWPGGRCPTAHSSGRNSRHCSGQEAVSLAAWTLTATWQFARLPSAPQYCGATPTDIRPSLGNDTSSITQAAGLTSGSSRSLIRRCTGTGSHGRLVHELLQVLLVAVRQPRGHRLDRLAAAVQHQAPQIAVALGPLILARHRGEHIGHEQRQRRPNTVHFMRVHTPNMLLISSIRKT